MGKIGQGICLMLQMPFFYGRNVEFGNDLTIHYY